MRIQYTLLMLCAIGFGLQAFDNTTSEEDLNKYTVTKPDISLLMPQQTNNNDNQTKPNNNENTETTFDVTDRTNGPLRSDEEEAIYSQNHDNQTNQTETHNEESPIVTGGTDMPFKLNEQLAYKQLQHDIYGQDHELSEVDQQTLNKYIQVFHQLRNSAVGNLKKRYTICPWYWGLKQEELKRYFPVKICIIQELLQNNNLPCHYRTAAALCDRFQEWRDQGIQSLMNEQHSKQQRLEGIYNTFGTPGLAAYNVLTSRKTHRAVGGAVTGLASSYGAMHVGAQVSKSDDSVLTLLATGVASWGASVIGGFACKNDRWFTTSYAICNVAGHTMFNKYHRNNMHETRYVGIASLHASAASAPAIPALAYAFQKHSR